LELIDKLPSFYVENDIVKAIQNALSIEANILKDEVENLLNQMNVDTSTYGLDYWENMLNVDSKSFDIQTRKENIKAKMRTKGASTIATIKNICEAYSNGTVNIIENPTGYSFKIKFIGSLGIPKAFDELDRTINEIKPCHIAHSYEYTYNTYNDLSIKTHQQLHTYTHKQLREVKL
jgi:hypothetical protein